jgi:hypothetical protein
VCPSQMTLRWFTSKRRMFRFRRRRLMRQEAALPLLPLRAVQQTSTMEDLVGGVQHHYAVLLSYMRTSIHQQILSAQ